MRAGALSPRQALIAAVIGLVSAASARGQLSAGPGFIASDARPGLEAVLLAPFQSIPSIYAKDVARFLDQCPGTTPKAGTVDSLCVRAIAMASALDSNHAFDPRASRAVAEFRVDFLSTARQGFAADPNLADPQWFRKIRLLAYLEEGVIAPYLATQAVDDSIPEAVAEAQSALRARLAPIESRLACLRTPENRTWSQRFPGPLERMVLFLSKVDPDLETHLRLAIYAEMTGKMDPLFRAEGFDAALARFDYTRILDGMREDSLRSRIWQPKAPAFSHRLKNLLHDAVWVEEMQRAPAFGLSGYLVQGSYSLSDLDSSVVAAKVREFGIRNRKLAYRIDISDSRTWADPRHLELDTLAEAEVRRINKALSPDLRAYLESEPKVDLRLLLHGRWHGDYFGPLKVFSRIKDLAGEAPAYAKPGLPGAAEWLQTAFPQLPPALAARLAGGDKEALKALRSGLAGDMALLNAARLTLGHAEWEEFLGTNEILRRIAAGKSRI